MPLSCVTGRNSVDCDIPRKSWSDTVHGTRREGFMPEHAGRKRGERADLVDEGRAKVKEHSD
jgi:hypothetical protein